MGFTTKNGLIGLVLATWLVGCAESGVMTTDQASPATGDTAAVEAVPASEVVAPVEQPAPEAVKPKKKFRRTKAKKEEVTVVATTANQPPELPLPMPKMDPVTESELKQAAQVQEAEVGIVGFISQHMLVVISALCLAAAGLYAFVVYPARRGNHNQNRFG